MEKIKDELYRLVNLLAYREGLAPWQVRSIMKGCLDYAAPAAADQYRYQCPDCAVEVGCTHREGCDVERCTVCGEQRMCCECEEHMPEHAIWTGLWPGQEACYQLNWFSKLVPGVGWVRCAPDDPEASPDLNRWTVLMFNNREGRA